MTLILLSEMPASKVTHILRRVKVARHMERVRRERALIWRKKSS